MFSFVRKTEETLAEKIIFELSKLVHAEKRHAEPAYFYTGSKTPAEGSSKG